MCVLVRYSLGMLLQGRVGHQVVELNSHPVLQLLKVLGDLREVGGLLGKASWGRLKKKPIRISD